MNVLFNVPVISALFINSKSSVQTLDSFCNDSIHVVIVSTNICLVTRDLYPRSVNYPCPDNFNPADHYIFTLAIVPGEEEACRNRVSVSIIVARKQSYCFHGNLVTYSVFAMVKGC